MMLATLSKHSTLQWPWHVVRAMSTGQIVVSAEVAQHVSQYGHGLIKLPADMVQILDGYFKDAGLTGRTAKLRTRALTDQLKALTRSTAVGGVQPYRTPDTGAAATAVAAARPGQVMTQQQLQEEQQMEGELQQLAETFGPQVVEQHRKARERAAALAALPVPRTKGGRVKMKAKAALLQHMSTHGFLSLPHEYVRAALDLPSSAALDDPDRNLELKKLVPTYNESQALAYALSRLPGCYAASVRIFRELSVRLPDFQPKTLLDFGSGPGTAAWAAQEAWPESLCRVLAVEPSHAMRQLGAQLEAARRFAHPHAPLVRWCDELPAPAKNQRMRRQQACHDVVVASYVLGELPDPQERLQLVRRLWGSTSGILVLVEPGTPAGAANIQEARAAILQHEARRAAKLQRRLGEDMGTGDGMAATAAGPGSSSSSGAAMVLQQKLDSKWYGAHVVAPCPHDGPCPLAAPGSKAWCHFGTRFQRPTFMQAAKALRGSHMNPADHQDERYSYVVIRRGARPIDVAQVEVSRGFLPKVDTDQHSGSSRLNVFYNADDDDDDVEELHSAASISRRQTGLNTTAPGNNVMQLDGERLLQASSGYQLSAQEAAVAGDNDGVGPRTLQSSQGLVTNAELQQLSALIGLAGFDSTRQQQPLPQCSDLEESTAASDRAADNRKRDHFKRMSVKFDAFGQGLVDKLVAMEDAGVNWAEDGNVSSVQDVERVARPAAASTSKSVFSAEAAASSRGSSPDNRPPVLGTKTDNRLPPSDITVTAVASIAWSRLIRPPRIRGGHVILDVCAPGSGPQQATCGQLERHIVARSDTKKWMGRAAYLLGQNANWGDLWPSFYNRNSKRQALTSSE